MKIPLSWVGLFSPVSDTLTSYGAKSLAHEYSIRTAEIEALDTYAFDPAVIVAKVVSTAPHPDSDHLNLVQVDVWGEVRQIVCGAANVVGAKYVPLATEGAVLGEGFVIKRAKIRGQESNGMICSLDELGLQEDRAEGIFRLEEAYPESFLESRVGSPFGDLPLEIPGLDGSHPASLQDVVFEIDNKFITNRPDLFSVEGNAREFSALFDLPFRPYDGEIASNEGMGSVPEAITPLRDLGVRIESDRVLSYRLLSVRGVRAKPSPFSVRTLLSRSGGNPKLDLIDMTNYVMTELGQPMHAFDADKVDGTVHVRLAKAGESLLALDGKQYSLTPEDLVIADDSKVLAIAGVIGGASSAVNESTTNLLIESATFDPTSVRLTAQRTGCRTDASTRYEKSLDPILTKRALARTLDLLRFFGNDFTVDAGSHYLDESRLNRISVSLPVAFVETKLGVAVPESEISRILGKLGFEHALDSGTLTVSVPSWRATKDVSIAEDIVEEIGRVYGYDKIDERPIQGGLTISKPNREIEFRNRVLSHFVSLGFCEAYTYSFSNAQKDASIGFADTNDAVRILNAVSAEFTHMRRSPAALLFQAVTENAKHAASFKFFEYGKVHRKESDGRFIERRSLAGVAYGSGALEARDAVLSFLSSVAPECGFSVLQGADAAKFPFLHPGKCGTVRSDASDAQLSGPIAAFGTVHPKVAEEYGFGDTAVAYFEIDPELAFSLSERYGEPVFHEIPKFPGVDRELNFVMDDRDSTGTAAATIASVSAFVSDVRVVDVYRDSAKIGEGKRSVTFAFHIEDPEKTITDADALSIQNAAVSAMEQAGFALRR